MPPRSPALKAGDEYPEEPRHQRVKYPNNVVEAGHGKLKQLIHPRRDFRMLKTVYAMMHRPLGSAKEFATEPSTYLNR